MKTRLKDFIYKNSKGIYKILNLLNGKYYVGSVSMSSFNKRYKQHKQRLIVNKHENIYLQNAVNKYGINNFLFIVEEILEENILLREQTYLDNLDLKYNINKNALLPPHSSLQTPEQKKKRIKTFTKTINEANAYWYDYKKNLITLEEIPIKYQNIIKGRKNTKVWNKGLTKRNFDYSFLNVPKTKTDKYYIGRLSFKEKMRNRKSSIDVFDYNGTFIKTFRSPTDIVEYTLIPHDLPLILKTNKEFYISKKKTTMFYTLNINNILKVLSGKQKHVKGLIFRYSNSDIPVVPLTCRDIWHKSSSFKKFKFYNHAAPLCE